MPVLSGREDYSQKRYLIIQSAFGLCNRLMSLASYFPVAEYTNRVLKMNWSADELVGNCKFTDLFRNDLAIEDIHALNVGESFRGLYLNYGVVADCDSDLELINQIPQFAERFIGVTLSCYFKPDFIDGEIYQQSVQQFLRDLRPIESIQREITEFCTGHDISPDNPDMLGLHIRRVDGQRKKNLSTDAQFIAIVEHILGRNPAKKFFLSTDCAETEHAFVSRYPDSIVVYSKGYLDKQMRGTSLQDAVVDLFILANTSRVYGSYGSSYSKVASVMCGCEFHQVGFDSFSV